MATSAPASIIDWVYDMARDSWTDRRGRPVLDWPHCEAIARSWFQAWYGNEKRLKRDPWAQRTGCSHCQRPGSSHSDGNVKVFVDPRTNKPISKIDAAAMIGSGLDPLESPVRCPHCNPRPDGRHTAWLRENSFPAWTSGRQMIDVLSLVPGAVMP